MYIRDRFISVHVAMYTLETTQHFCLLGPGGSEMRPACAWAPYAPADILCRTVGQQYTTCGNPLRERGKCTRFEIRITRCYLHLETNVWAHTRVRACVVYTRVRIIIYAYTSCRTGRVINIVYNAVGQLIRYRVLCRHDVRLVETVGNRPVVGRFFFFLSVKNVKTRTLWRYVKTIAARARFMLWTPSNATSRGYRALFPVQSRSTYRFYIFVFASRSWDLVKSSNQY